MRRALTLLVFLALAAPATAAPIYDIARPNIVFVLADDLSSDLLQFMPNVQQLQRDGVSFDNYVVSAALCCPSRASILTGRLPHNTGVFTNIYPHGGIYAFAVNDNARRSFAVTLRGQGYRTALMGKYLNGYAAATGNVPPGWTDWAATARGYQGFDYTLNVNGAPVAYGAEEPDYLMDVIARRGLDFIDSATASGRPFFLELSAFTPHRPAVPATRHLGLFPDVKAPRGPAFNRAVRGAPPWLAGRPERPQAMLDRIDSRYRNRARSVVAIDEALGRLRERLAATGQAGNTYVIFSSDNGYHMGEHRLLPGKLTAFDHDIRVPLIAAGPGVPAGSRVEALTQNTDLAPTFEELAGALPRSGVDGRSLAGLMHGQAVPDDWRGAVLVEHKRTARDANDPDEQTPASGDPPTYKAMRTATTTYVEYRTGAREFYDLRADPHQLTNRYRSLSADRRRRLRFMLASLVTCDGARQCATRSGLEKRAARAARRGRSWARRR